MKSVRSLILLLLVATSTVIAFQPSPAMAKPRETKQVAKKEAVVYATARGKKYHRANCPFIVDRETTKMSIADAQAKGLAPCGRCYKDAVSQ